ncbi:hypothetical protein JTE90_023947 [Oedothorax gibbosus]|uniref:Uncharacterized protein n=1 Tax=Oedothorax gibbosus TaxID=931172 RepID=A0AAV6US89_9ARAC|nr:hypothetical protein JTE90_023947 [Oedothorax gibbosus]
MMRTKYNSFCDVRGGRVVMASDSLRLRLFPSVRGYGARVASLSKIEAVQMLELHLSTRQTLRRGFDN